ncbi:N-acetylmuramoyl-L-alanine amidase [Deinococcus deserti]|uniref:Putative N-acetylmuramoyl-L-alanine amidase n=1 Tax=Deinococcus deserti (strain DSM 17065 / CIP 109153 / LMG 22923 / VCD115) TaxID=546414 RepID=C1CZR1_DEIDV|nr:N-acetylmuramoyl-L-alanine amidase [Deinococcus deserti]ACO47309.1 putative N-acetylmuramoyl-L-alanine amidase, precursor [Deinococcus deserti VCD115]
MKRIAIFLSSALLVAMASHGRAQSSDPFQRTAPVQTLPALRGTSPITSPLKLTGTQNAAFGTPRASSDGSNTRVVFDLQPGVTYSLTPTFTGLRLDIQGARVIPAVTARLGASVSEYRAGGGQATLITPFPLSFIHGWKAMEATLANGNRVLIVEFGPTVEGGASAALKANVRVSPAPAAPQAPASTAKAPVKEGLPPGDTVAKVKVLPPAPALPGADVNVPSVLEGRISGTPQAGAQLTAPRIGKNPGQTRVVLDLPPGAGYRIVPSGLSLRVELTGVTGGAQAAENVSPELRSWSFEPVSGGVQATLVTAARVTERSGWRAQLLPPSGNDRSRLVIDIAPAMANLTPLTAREKVLGAVPPVPVTRGTAILALSASYAQPRVVLDPGHGGRDPGAVGTVVEKEITLGVALRVRDLLRAAGVDVVMTRDTDRALHSSKNADLEMRAAASEPGTQLFVSIHVNALEAKTALRGYGIETWWNPNHPLSSSLAAILQRSMVEQTGAFSRGLKNNLSLSVLRNSRVPAALVEIGYTSHPVDGLNLQDENYLDRVALGVANGIREALISGVTASRQVLSPSAGGAEK